MQHPIWQQGATCAALLFALLLGAAPACWAHAMPKSLVSLEIREFSVEAHLQLPIDRLQYAFGHPLNNTGLDLTRTGDDLIDYLKSHVRPTAPDGRAWEVMVGNLKIQSQDGAPFLLVDLTLTPPLGAPNNRFRLNYDVITHEIVTHTVLVSLSTDWKNGVFLNQPLLIGVLRSPINFLQIDRSEGSVGRGFYGMVKLGMAHIAEGTDHLLFLLVLLLSAPLIASGKGWRATKTPLESVKAVLKIVTAFSIGHSLTLAAGAMSWVVLPERPVEILIAVSILVSAAHALKPLFAGYEVMIAGLFGLIHGLAFAATLVPLGLEPYGLVIGIFGFNLGIELMQLGVVAAILPWLILLSSTPIYRLVRITGATFGILAATGWVIERAGNVSIPSLAIIPWLAQHALWLVATLASLSILSALITSRRTELKPQRSTAEKSAAQPHAP